jgi:uncharacterized phiE125 gp8 family phage protein
MMLVEETAVPDAALPIEAFKAHLRLGTGFSDDAVQDVVLASFLRAALAAIEARSGRSILERSFSWTLTAWRDRSRQILPIAEVSSVQIIKFKDQAGDETTLSDTDYRLTLDSNRPCLVSTSGWFPVVPARGSVVIQFVAGFGPDWQDVPADMAQAVLLLASHYYEYRSDSSVDIGTVPFGVLSLIERYRVVRGFGGRS